MSDKEVQWFVLYCAKDDSHVLVPEDAVIYDESVKIDDEVRFSYPGEKGFLYGIVKGKSCNKKTMVKLQNDLNVKTKPKRDSSFHDDRPRKAALKCKASYVKTCAVKRKSSKTGEVSSNDTKRAKLNQTESSKAKFESEHNNEHNKKNKSCEQKQSAVKTKPSILGKVLQDSCDETSSGSSSSDENCPLTVLKSHSAVSNQTCSSKIKTLSQDLSVDKPKSSVNSVNHLVSGVEHQKNDVSQDHDIDDISSIKNISDSSDSSSSDSDLTQEELLQMAKRLAKFSKKKKAEDIEELMSLVNKQSRSEKSTSKPKTRHPIDYKEPSSIIDELDTEIHTMNDHMLNMEAGNSVNKQESAPDCKDETEAPSVCSKSKKLKSLLPSMKVFEGQYFNYKPSDPNVVKLQSDYEVYIASKDLKNCKKKCNTANAVARLLLRHVFTSEARIACSVSGKPTTNRTTGQQERRPPLDEDGVAAIIEFALARASKKGWPQPPESALKQSMNNQLCESRADERLKREKAEVMAQMKAARKCVQ